MKKIIIITFVITTIFACKKKTDFYDNKLSKKGGEWSYESWNQKEYIDGVMTGSESFEEKNENSKIVFNKDGSGFWAFYDNSGLVVRDFNYTTTFDSTYNFVHINYDNGEILTYYLAFFKNAPNLRLRFVEEHVSSSTVSQLSKKTEYAYYFNN